MSLTGPSFLSLALLSCAAIAALACGPAQVSPRGGGASSDVPGGMVPGVKLPDGGLVAPDAGAAGAGGAGPAVAPMDPGAATCAMEVHHAERLPVDLLLLLDSSTSMESRLPGDLRRKGDVIGEALPPSSRIRGRPDWA